MLRKKPLQDQSASDVGMVTTYPLWDDSAYAIRVLGQISALGDAGFEAGLLRVIPLRHFFCRERRISATQMRDVGVKTFDILQPPDLGHNVPHVVQSFILRVWLCILCEVGRVRLVHAQGIRAASLCGHLPRRIRVVADVHGDVVSEAILRSNEGSARKWSVHWAELDTKSAMNRADHLISVSPAMSEWLSRVHNIDEDKIREVPCGVDVGRFSVVPSRQRTKDRLVVVYCGGLQSYQPASLVARTCIDLDGIFPGRLEFLIVTRDDASDIVADLLDQSIPVEVRSATSDQVPCLISSGDVGIIPRDADPTNMVASPTKLAEYLAAGMPVLCSEHIGGWAKMLEERDVGVSLHSGPGQIADFLCRLEVEREVFRRRCKTVAFREWEWSQLTYELLKAYGQDELLDRAAS